MKLEIEKGFARIFWDALLCVAIYLVCVSLPAPPFFTQISFTGVLRYLALPIVVLLLYADGLRLEAVDFRKVLLCVPLIFVCFGNMVSLWTSGAGFEPNAIDLERAFIYTLATAVVEEWVFRFGVMNALKHTNVKNWDILILALLFGICHLFSLFSGTAVLSALAQAGYTFLLGLLLGVAYKVGGILPAIMLHLLFNFFQNDLYLASGGGSWNASFFAWNIGLFVLSALYAAFLWWRYLMPRKQK